jgi:phosphopantothenoylcysteine decarboxylase/phosphopantothenate--cysteine ligase
MELEGKRVALGVTGGIAAYKAAELTRLLVREGASVHVAMTEAATRFVTPTTFQALSGNPVLTGLWDASAANGMAHIGFSREADVLLVAPASADFLAKAANGIADDLLSTLTLARNCPLLVAPAMNREMWGNPATRRNVALLTHDGVGVFGPARGEQACGEVGDGRMLEPAEIVEELAAHFQPKTLEGRKVLLTAGPTFEAIDPVRGITNLSSGRMGLAVARAAREAGAEVTLVCGPVALPAPRGVARIDVTSALEMHAQVMSRAAANDVFIAVAAVADYRPRSVSNQKVKRDGCPPRAIELVENPDILADVAALPHPPLCVGFAAETQNLSEYAERKRRAKKIPLIVGNLIADGFGGDANTLVLFDDGGQQALEPASKLELARRLIARIAALLENPHAPR